MVHLCMSPVLNGLVMKGPEFRCLSYQNYVIYACYLFQGVVIGLEMTTLTVSESSGSIEVMVKVTSGEINTPVVVSLSTLSRTAVG